MTGRQKCAALIVRNWRMVRAYRDLEAMDRKEGRDADVRRWRKHRAEALLSIRELREAVR